MGAPDQQFGDSLEVDLQNKKFSLTGQHVSLFFLFFIAIGTGALVWIMYQHQQDGRDTGKAFVEAIQQQTKAMQETAAATRELTCLTRFQSQPNAAELCRSISR